MLGNEANLKEALFKYKKLMDDFGYNFVLVKGSLLGAYRDKRLLPWDEDIDTEMPIGDCKICKTLDEIDIFDLLREATKRGFTHTTFGHQFQVDIGHNTHLKWKEYLKDPKFIWDRFGMTWKGSYPSIELLKGRGGRVHIDGFVCPQNVSKVYDTLYDNKNIQQIELYGERFYIPSDPEKHLQNVYGNTWRNVFCSTTLWMKYGKDLKKGNIPLSIQRFMKDWEKKINEDSTGCT